ncbi:hypothetical protein ACQE3E_15615 [Methylomonas sp. MED-D]|uniref:VpaChn25_0724 family phage protein n=1 Tax=unclassified Methylomonas TaxID=2608980 RepID=UPI00143BBA56|nr:hypothetical protein [Methylococcaceae bacterium WWC4]
MNYNEKMTEHRRLAILELLAGAYTYTLHEVDLKNALAQRAQAVGTDVLRADLAWLNEQGLVRAEQPGGVWMATLTARGGDVRQGLSTVPGVARPEPGR